MIHHLLYVLHLAGMAAVILFSLQLLLNKSAADSTRKKFATVLMSASHAQLLTGFALFFLLLSEVNHMKVGIKMLLAIELSVLATIYRKRMMNNAPQKPLTLILILVSAITITAIAFLW